MFDTEWSDQQKEIFAWFRDGGRGNLVVRARAGTGKTTTIVQAIVYAPEEKILMAAFNKRIQEELNSRIRNRRAQAKTLHALGLYFVKRNWPDVVVDTSGERADGLVRRALFSMFSELYPDANKPEKIEDVEFNETVVRLGAKILTSSRDVAPFATTEAEILDVVYDFDHVPEIYLEAQGWTCPVLARVALRAMELALLPTKTIDFADMIYLPLRQDWVQGTYDLVCVDEAQDMNIGQLTLATRVCKPGGRIAVIGDDRQAIYGFRGADSNSLDRLKKELNAKELGLTTTYRCSRQVVDYAVTLVPDIQVSATALLGAITLVQATELHKLVRPGDFVLSRSNAPLTKACLALIRQGVRAKIVGRDIGQRLTNIAKKLRAHDVRSFYEKLGEWARKEIDRAKKANRKGRIQLICDQADTLRALLFGIDDLSALFLRIEDMFGDPSAAFVKCSSVHRAKGLEAERVFVLQDTLYPGKWAKDAVEEQNIEYVAVTRSKDQLFWVNGFNPKKRHATPPVWEDDRWKRSWSEDEDDDDDGLPLDRRVVN
jgi:DNA helicase-2/ATP-dependent DNA helicase PcrA